MDWCISPKIKMNSFLFFVQILKDITLFPNATTSQHRKSGIDPSSAYMNLKEISMNQVL